MPFNPGDMNAVLAGRVAAKDEFGAPPGSVNGSPVAAKASAMKWLRQKPAGADGEKTHFEVARQSNPAKYKLWGDQFLTTSAATEFTAPPMKPATGATA
jgi:hypothetical protein